MTGRDGTKLFLMDTCESGELEDRTFASADASLSKVRARSARGLKAKVRDQQPGGARPRTHLLETNRFIYNDHASTIAQAPPFVHEGPGAHIRSRLRIHSSSSARRFSASVRAK